MWGKEYRGTLLLSAQFFCDPKTTLKNSLLFFYFFNGEKKPVWGIESLDWRQ